MTYEELIAFIKANVFENNEELITGENLQKVELAVAEFFHTSDTSNKAEIDKLIADLKAEVQRATAKETELEGRVDANEGQIRNKLNIVDAIGKKTRNGGEIFNDYAGNEAGSYAQASGYDTKAFGRDSHTEGEGTIANNEAEHAQGKFNYPTSDSVDSTGIGTSDDERKNATLTTAGGKHYILGVGGYLGRDIIGMKDVASVINEALASIQSNSESIATNAGGIATNKEDITKLKAVKREVYPNNTGTNVFNLSTDSTSAEIKQVLTTAQGVFALPNAGDEFQVLENSTLRDSGIVISRSETEATQDIIILSNNLTAGYIQVTSLTLEYNKRIGADSLKVQRAEHQVVDPKLIDENKLAKLYADQERTSKEVNEYNISAINGSPYVSLQGAISALNSYLKDGKFVGTKVTWTQAETNKVFTHMYTGGSFVNVQSWKELPNDLKTINGESLNGSGDISTIPKGGYNRGLYESAGAKFNELTGYYELNGLTDITEREMSDIYATCNLNYISGIFNSIGNNIIRTNFGIDKAFFSFNAVSMNRIFVNSLKIEVVALNISTNKANGFFKATDLEGAFAFCGKLMRVIGVIDVSLITDSAGFANIFYTCTKLIDFRIKGLRADIKMEQSSLLSVSDDENSSVGYMLINAIGGSQDKPITATFHKDVYDKIMASAFLKSKAQEKHIIIAQAA